MKLRPVLLSLVLVLTVLISCQAPPKQSVVLLDKSAFEKEVDGKKVSLYTLTNKNGLVCQITNYGGKVVNLWVPDGKGSFADVVLGHDNIEEYLISKEKYFGALIGRYGNRIANGKFTIDSVEYSLAINNEPNHLHGGNKGYESVVWEPRQTDGQTLELSYLSRHLEEGYPGNLRVNVRYQLTDGNELKIEYRVTTDQITHINLTHHSFFNLQGAAQTINDHLLLINADYYTPVDAGLIPTGEFGSCSRNSHGLHKAYSHREAE